MPQLLPRAKFILIGLGGGLLLLLLILGGKSIRHTVAPQGTFTLLAQVAPQDSEGGGESEEVKNDPAPTPPEESFPPPEKNPTGDNGAETPVKIIPPEQEEQGMPAQDPVPTPTPSVSPILSAEPEASATPNPLPPPENPNPIYPAPLPTTVSHVVISEVQISGGPGHTTDDYIELYNPFSEPFNLKGYRLVKRTKTGSTDTSLKSWTTDTYIPAQGLYRWANKDYATIGKSPDTVTAGSIASDNGIALRKGGEDTGIIIDSLAWGAAENIFKEGNGSIANPAPNEKLRRIEWQDTDDNAQDFQFVF